MLDESWVGRRVVIRRVLPGPAARARGAVFSDVTGDLVGFDDRRARVLTRQGPVEVERAAITHAKLVAASTAAIIALEQVANDGWRAAEVTAANGWLLRADHGFTVAANSVLALRSPTPDLGAAVTGAQAWYAARDLPLRIACPLPARMPLDTALAGLGWVARTDVEVLTAPTARLAARSAEPAGPSGPPAVELAAEPDGPWLAHYRPETAPSGDVVRALLTRHPRVVFASITADGRVVAIARGTLDGEWLGLSALAVDPDSRHRGLAPALVTELAGWASRRGATRAYLPVESTNRPALGLGERLGFWRHHTYRVRSHPTMV